MQAGETVREVIASQAAAWDRVVGTAPRRWPVAGRVLCVGSGTSYYLAQVVAALGRKRGREMRACPTQDIILEPAEALKAVDAVVIISRSGETSEALWSAEIARQAGKLTLGVTCTEAAPLAARVDEVWSLPFAHDHTVVMVRSFTTMLLAFEWALAHAVGDTAGVQALQALVQAAPAFIGQAETELAPLFATRPRRVYILGAGVRYGVALEGALKCGEMSTECAAAYGPLEFRHGPWGSVTPEDVVVVLGQTALAHHEHPVLHDVAARTGRVLTIAAPAFFSGLAPHGARCVLPPVAEAWAGPLAVVPLQWLGYHWALSGGRNPDTPPNLTPVVDLTYGP